MEKYSHCSNGIKWKCIILKQVRKFILCDLLPLFGPISFELRRLAASFWYLHDFSK
jgi:hypothetical protein